MDTTPTVPESWERDLDQSRADLAAGRVVDGKTIRERLRGTIAALEPETPADDTLTPLRR